MGGVLQVRTSGTGLCAKLQVDRNTRAQLGVHPTFHPATVFKRSATGTVAQEQQEASQLGVHRNLLAVDPQAVAVAVDFVREAAVHRVVLEHIGHVLCNGDRE